MSDPYLQALLAIPPGQTRTYLELAFEAGRPGGARTASKVLNTCANTDHGPWHRVVYASGALNKNPELAAIQWSRLQAEGARPRTHETPSVWANRVNAAFVGQMQTKEFLAKDDARINKWPKQKVEPFASEHVARSRFFRHADEPKPPNPTTLPGRRKGQVDLDAFNAHLGALPFEAARQPLAERGWVHLPGVFRPEDCAAILGAATPDAFVKTNYMTPKGLGRGAYHVWAEPLPEPAESLREALYARLACFGDEAHGPQPRTLPDLHAACRKRNQIKPSCILLSYGKDGINYLHQDRYGPVFSPYQGVVLLSQQGLDYEGGNFKWVQEPPGEPPTQTEIPANQGDLILFAGARVSQGTQWIPVRHGMTRVTSGHRWALGLVFHLAR